MTDTVYATLDGSGSVTGWYANAPPDPLPPGGVTAILMTDARIVAFQAEQASAAALQSALASAIASGISITSTSTPSLSGTYAVDESTQAKITSTMTGISLGLGLPGGGSTFIYPDIAGAPHTFTQAQFQNFAIAVRNYVYSLLLYAAGQGTLPSSAITIP